VEETEAETRWERKKTEAEAAKTQSDLQSRELNETLLCALGVRSRFASLRETRSLRLCVKHYL